MEGRFQLAEPYRSIQNPYDRSPKLQRFTSCQHQAEFNHHLGRVVAPLESGRVGVVLHGVISQKAAPPSRSLKEYLNIT